MVSTLAIRVRPGASRTVVGGEHDGALVVRVTARAIDGAANEAALRAIASAFGLRRRDVQLVRGTTSRNKLVGLDADAARVAATRARLLTAESGRLGRGSHD